MKEGAHFLEDTVVNSAAWMLRRLEEVRIPADTVEPIREKDGIALYRICSTGARYVVKCFAREADRREIANYGRLAALGIPTIDVIASTADMIVLEDLAYSETYRPGVAADLDDSTVAARLAGWYRLLHDRGRAYVRRFGQSMYDEADAITREGILAAAQKTGTWDAPVWRVLLDRLDDVLLQIRAVERTLAYNDFYYTNLAVARDGSEALMFDYNFLGKGYVLADLRNVTSSLSSEAAAAFLAAYGAYDAAEERVDAVAAPLTTLIFAARRDPLPLWAGESAGRVRSGALLRAVYDLLGV